jgi:hypothetical protein
MYVTPGIQNLIRENKSYRIDSEIQTGKRYGMQLLDDNLWQKYLAGMISAEDCIDRSKNPGYMMEKIRNLGVEVANADDALIAEAEEAASAGDGSGPQDAAAKQAEIEARRRRMQGGDGRKAG